MPNNRHSLISKVNPRTILKRQFPFPRPSLAEIPKEELAWPEVISNSLSLPKMELEKISGNFLDIPIPENMEFLNDTLPNIISIDSENIFFTVELIDLLKAFDSPQIDGAIFVKTEQSQKLHGNIKTKTQIAAFRSKEKLDPKAPKGLSLFDMLLPILMPPANTEFSDDLLFPAELFPYQRAGVKWLFENDNALLGDDMGLGKTVQAITAFRALLRRSQALQALVICPKSLLPNWMRELEKWAPELVAIRIHGDQLTRKIGWRAFKRKCHVIVTTYETVRQDIDFIANGFFDVVIVDEIQRLKNSGTTTARAMRKLNSPKKWGLSGTPLENRIEDVISIFNFIRPGLFSTSEIPGLTNREISTRIRPYILRRRKEEALPDLKKMFIDTKYLELTADQRDTYDKVEQLRISQIKSNQNASITHVLALIQELKQICNFDPTTNQSSKMEFVEEYLEEACSEDDKVIIVSQYVKTLGVIQGKIGGYQSLLYSGALSLNQRSTMEKQFNEDDNCKVMLLSLKAGGLGLNLSRANYLLHFDRWWNPAIEEQASARIHRIGQMKQVFISRLICEDTIEEKIETILEQKRILFNQVVNELADINLEKVLSEEELFGLFGLKPPQRKKFIDESDDQKRKRSETTDTSHDTQPSQQESIVIKPEEPYSNLIKMRQILRGCEEYIWWADMHFSSRALEELIVIADPSLIKDIKILSGPANINRRTLGEFNRFQQELKTKGIDSDWKVLKEFAHDRFIISRNNCYNIPPVNSWLKGSYSEILPTSNKPPFQQWWTQATSMEQVLGGQL
ncbi:DEAD/DEAH box helicase [Chloroflexota bacterium]